MGPYGMGDTLHICSLDNTTKAWGGSSAIKGNDGVYDPSLCIYLWFFLPFIELILAINSEKRTKSF